MFKEKLRELSPELSDEQVDTMAAYYNLLIAANQDFNLTAIVDPHEAAAGHFYDSIFCAHLIPTGARVLDVGTGAGFPGIPLKIVRPDIRLTLMDSTGKKIEFVKTAAQSLGIAADFLYMRAEEAANGEMRESFDVCVSRAVASLPVLAELCLPFVRVGGIFLAYKTEGGEERAQAAKSIARLGGALTETCHGNAGNNHVVLAIRKKNKTPDGYPRRYARIVKNPL